jgi:hypothetical protein
MRSVDDGADAKVEARSCVLLSLCLALMCFNFCSSTSVAQSSSSSAASLNVNSDRSSVASAGISSGIDASGSTWPNSSSMVLRAPDLCCNAKRWSCEMPH